MTLEATMESLETLANSAEAGGEATAEAAKPFVNLISNPLEDLSKAGWLQILIFIALVVLGIVLLRRRAGHQTKWSAKMLAHAAISLALSFALSYIKIFSMGAGGSVTPGSMLPVMLFSAYYGLGPGLLVGFAYALLQIVQDYQGIGIMGLLLDYLLAFSALGLAGMAKHLPEKWGLYLSMLVALLTRFICHTLSSMVVYHLNLAGSLAYNVPYMLPEIIFCMILGVIIGKRILSIMKRT